jgi:hypothetical protein
LEPDITEVALEVEEVTVEEHRELRPDEEKPAPLRSIVRHVPGRVVVAFKLFSMGVRELITGSISRQAMERTKRGRR